MNVLTHAEAAALPRWVGWRNEVRGGRPTKVPYDAARGDEAKADDPGTWDMRPRAEAWARKHVNGAGGGVGMQLGALAERPRVAHGGVDLDTCRGRASGEIQPWAAEVIQRFGTYAEVSPSGKGVKAFFTYAADDVPVLRDAMRSDHGRSFKRGKGEHPPAIELHIGNRFFAVTDQHLDDTPAGMQPVPLTTLLWLIRHAGPDFAAGGPANDPSGANQGPGQVAPDGDALMVRLRAAVDEDGALAGRWEGDTGGLKDGSRSALAFALGAAVKRHGFSFAEMRERLRRNPYTAGWTVTKGEADGARELRRIWEKVGAGTPGGGDWPPAQLDLATADPVPPPAFDLALFPSPWARWSRRGRGSAAGLRRLRPLGRGGRRDRQRPLGQPSGGMAAPAGRQ